MAIRITASRRTFAIAIALCGALQATSAFAWSDASQYNGTQPCDNELNTVGYAIWTAQFTGQKPAIDQANLLSKLDSARAKVGLQKYADALGKLDDLHLSVENMVGAPKPKLAEASAGAIYTALGSAALCIGALR